eukprot:247638-Chlamydomonas_euryale.AAC.1
MTARATPLSLPPGPSCVARAGRSCAGSTVHLIDVAYAVKLWGVVKGSDSVARGGVWDGQVGGRAEQVGERAEQVGGRAGQFGERAGQVGGRAEQVGGRAGQ